MEEGKENGKASSKPRVTSGRRYVRWDQLVKIPESRKWSNVWLACGVH